MAASIATLLQQGRHALIEAGVANPGLDATVLLEAATGYDRTTMIAYPERQVGEAQFDAYDALLRRRAEHEPVSRLIGTREFWSLDFEVNRFVLDPRPDSETLVSAALSWLEDKGPSALLDLGTGSGCLLLAVLHERNGDVGLGIDASPGAIDTARRNASALGLDERACFGTGNWCAGLPDKTFDVVLSNPPYIPTAEIVTLEPEVACHDPLAALDGGLDGLTAYRQLAGEIPRVVKPQGVAFIEIGAGQAEAVTALFMAAGAVEVAAHRDLGGHVRCLRVTYG